MSKLKGNLLYGQSGGPTSVINASAYGVITEAIKNTDEIEEVYVMRHGIQGALNEEFFAMTKQDPDHIEFLKHTPGSAFGSVRYKMLDFKQDETDYIRLLYIFRKYNIRYFLYNGGNDSMDTCYKIAEYMKHVDYDIVVVGIPKTIDNDLPFTDHTPGYGSAAKYVANTMQEVAYDMLAYPKGKVTIVEIMGRHAGWLTAAASLASVTGYGPDLIYLPEVPFSIEKFKADVRRVYGANHQCLIAVSEGLINEEGILIGSSSGLKDAFGHFQLGGVSSKLSNILNSEMRISSRTIELGTTQRAAAHMQSQVDVDEAIEVGRRAVRYAVKGEHGVMVTMTRVKGDEYKIKYGKHPLSEIANVERTIPKTMINEDGNGVTQEFIDYALPLIKGHNTPKFKNGLQQFSTLQVNTVE
ncbi:6-phosphofructokinase [Candidatus Xianfuyuplasma coldseepsis]|uniref:Pyrophosphate--fructose 6-phosphate 1-phosphotransferase n=1 Tax=Candidatus Xianfuyuplasma coldseepsis TaxID=2782163 RepID=A0A7L7KRK7_9MOLU|nr:6-phosphofructokinase [Xianfuyuplasma coldseepsis]QMS84584.1 6-phosphofructokinase [Xianfuyuplasma coldseepsis]